MNDMLDSAGSVVGEGAKKIKEGSEGLVDKIGDGGSVIVAGETIQGGDSRGRV